MHTVTKLIGATEYKVCNALPFRAECRTLLQFHYQNISDVSTYADFYSNGVDAQAIDWVGNIHLVAIFRLKPLPTLNH